MVRVTLFKYCHYIGSGDINSLVRDVEPHIIVHSRAGKGGHDFSGVDVEHEKLCRLARGDEQPMIGLVQAYRIGKFGLREGPARNLFVRLKVNDSDLFWAA